MYNLLVGFNLVQLILSAWEGDFLRTIGFAILLGVLFTLRNLYSKEEPGEDYED